MLLQRNGCGSLLLESGPGLSLQTVLSGATRVCARNPKIALGTKSSTLNLRTAAARKGIMLRKKYSRYPRSLRRKGRSPPAVGVRIFDLKRDVQG